LVIGIYCLVNFLYFTNLIPPIPLSLKEAGIYHSVQIIRPGNYNVTYEDYGWRGFFKLYPDFRAVNGAPVYAYSAIFSPIGLNITIMDEWQHYDTSQNKWITAGVISLPVIGGRAGGFHTFSTRSNLDAGKWRVNVKTSANQIIGQLRFNIVPVDTEPVLTNMIK
jgi:hypothetical protein